MIYCMSATLGEIPGRNGGVKLLPCDSLLTILRWPPADYWYACLYCRRLPPLLAGPHTIHTLSTRITCGQCLNLPHQEDGGHEGDGQLEAEAVFSGSCTKAERILKDSERITFMTSHQLSTMIPPWFKFTFYTTIHSKVGKTNNVCSSQIKQLWSSILKLLL